MGIVERFVERLDAQDWEGFAETISDGDFERVGPFGEVTSSKAAYVAFLAEAVPHLADYRARATRVVYADVVAFAEVTETFLLNGKPVELSEAWVIDLDRSGLVRRVAIYQTWPDQLTAAVEGGGAGPPA